tara:strand:+ start:384 stop:782 length:399 start_codon:yes stop_codon:yes gene_type:complete
MKRTKNDERYDIDFDRKVFVYKNLHKGCWSIKQDGIVKAHAGNVTLYNVTMKVNRKGRERVLREKRKNVHAGMQGLLKDAELELVWSDLPEDQFDEITYNPYKYSSFVHVKDGSPRWFGIIAKLEEKRVLIA